MLKVWNLTEGYEDVYKCDLETWEEKTNSERLDSHYDMIKEKWYFYERRKIGRTVYIYQISYTE